MKRRDRSPGAQLNNFVFLVKKSSETCVKTLNAQTNRLNINYSVCVFCFVEQQRG